MMANLYLGAYWKQRRLSLREYIAKCKHFLTTLRDAHPMFRQLVSWERTEDSAIVLFADLSNLDEAIVRHAPSENARYSHAGPNGEPSLDSECEDGFVTVYSNEQPSDGEKLSISITAGAHSQWLNNAVVIRFPQGSDEFAQYDFVRDLLMTTIGCWNPEFAVVSSHAFNDRVDEDGDWQAIGWMNWFRDSSVARALPKDIECTQWKGGILLTTTRERLTPDSPTHVSTARRVRDCLQAQGFLK